MRVIVALVAGLVAVSCTGAEPRRAASESAAEKGTKGLAWSGLAERLPERIPLGSSLSGPHPWEPFLYSYVQPPHVVRRSDLYRPLLYSRSEPTGSMGMPSIVVYSAIGHSRSGR